MLNAFDENIIIEVDSTKRDLRRDGGSGTGNTNEHLDKHNLIVFMKICLVNLISNTKSNKQIESSTCFTTSI